MSQTLLSRLPHFTFYQDEVEETNEAPINVTYYNGSIGLEQNGETVLIEAQHVKSLMRAILKNQEDADAMLLKH